MRCCLMPAQAWPWSDWCSRRPAVAAHAQVLVPSVASALLRAVPPLPSEPPGEPALPALRHLVFSGEPLPAGLPAAVLAALAPPRCTALNLYGATEAAADCTAFDVTPAGEGGRGTPPAADTASIAPLGAPIAGFAVAVVEVSIKGGTF